jgi:hypothetical protein
MNENIHNEIARLEERIDTLSVSIERCREISFAAKALITAGATAMMLMFAEALASALTWTLTWALPLNPTLFFLSLQR